MTARRVAAVLLVALVALVGCKKKPAADTGEPPQARVAPGTPNVVIPPPGANAEKPAPATGLSAGELIAVFNQMTEEANADKFPSFAAFTHTDGVHMPKGGTVSVDATARSVDLDAAFNAYWAAYTARPERIRQKMIRDQTDALTKAGTPPDQARQKAEQMHPQVRPVKVTTPTLEPGSRVAIEADVADGVKGDWSNNGVFIVTGSVRFTESLRVHTNGPLTVKLRGSVGTLILEANGAVHADLSELTVATVEAKPNMPMILRLGPSTRTLRIRPGAQPEVAILSRAGNGLKIEPLPGRTQPLRTVLVSY